MNGGIRFQMAANLAQVKKRRDTKCIVRQDSDRHFVACSLLRKHDLRLQ